MPSSVYRKLLEGQAKRVASRQSAKPTGASSSGTRSSTPTVQDRAASVTDRSGGGGGSNVYWSDDGLVSFRNGYRLDSLGNIAYPNRGGGGSVPAAGTATGTGAIAGAPPLGVNPPNWMVPWLSYGQQAGYGPEAPMLLDKEAAMVNQTNPWLGFNPWGGGYRMPAHTQPSYNQATYPSLDDSQFSRLMNWNTQVALPWGDMAQNESQFARNLAEVAQNNAFNRGFQQQQFGEDVRRYNTESPWNQWRTWNEVRLPWEQFAQANRQYEQDFTENVRRFNEQMQQQRIADRYATFGRAQAPNARFMTFG